MPGRIYNQLTFLERGTIEKLILQKESISSIGRILNRAPSTIKREIMRNGTDSPKTMFCVETRNICIHRNSCNRLDLCNKGCLTSCCKCDSWLCNSLCPDFETQPCPLHIRPPYCCNGCSEIYGYGCSHPYWFYEAKAAHEKAEQRKIVARLGIDCTPEELEETIAIVKAGVKNGQSIRHIFANNEGKLCCGWRTFYNWVDQGLIEGIANIDLSRRVRYKQRKKKDGSKRGIPREALIGRTYDDFENLTEQEKLSAVEVDTVVGRRGVDKQVILTLLFKRSRFQLMLLIDEKTVDDVIDAIDLIDSLCEGRFSEVFPVIVLDRGSEFADPWRIECRKNGTQRTRVYYCDPQHSQQKPKAEKNHEEIRKVLPKGKSNFGALKKPDMAVLMSHVNSYGREILNWAAPYDIAQFMLPKTLLDGLSIARIPANDIVLKPHLLPHAILKK